MLLALPPMALGHALSIWLVAATVMALGVVIDARMVAMAAGGLLILWAAYYWRYSHRHRVRVGMTTGLAGLALWSFLMASTHGAGLMLVPALIPLCGGTMPVIGGGSLAVALAAIGVHTLATLIVTGLIALVVYEWVGLGVLRRGWINFDLLWTGALVAVGSLLLAFA